MLPAIHEAWLPNEHPMYRPRHGRRQLAALISATVFFCAPLFLLVLGVRPEAIENRALTRFPSVTDGWGLVTGLDRWATDALPLRAESLRVNDWISRSVFGEPSLPGQRRPDGGPVQGPEPPARDEQAAHGFPMVIEGLDGWYYFGYDVQGACRPDRPPADVIAALRRLRSVVEASGRTVVVVVAPDKTTMVPEHLPATYAGSACAPTATAALWQRLIRDAGVVDLRAALHAVAQRTREPVYTKVDTHWTYAGGLVMATAIAERVRPGVTASWQILPGATITQPGDLPPLLGRHEEFSSRYYQLAPDGTTVRSRLAAREHILRSRPMATASTWLRHRLVAAYETWRDRDGTRQSPGDPLQPVRASREALRWRADAAAPSRLPLAPLLRKAMLRAIDHYDVHQRSVLSALTDGVEASVGRLAGRIEAVERRLDAHDDDRRIEALSAALDARLDGVADTIADLRHRMSTAEAAVRDTAAADDRRHDALREALDDARSAITDLAGRLLEFGEGAERAGTKVHEMFVERDRRADSGEQRLRTVERQLAAAERAAAVRHAPVPPGTAVVICDAGALLVPTDEVFLPWLTYHRSWEDAEARLMATLPGDGLFLDIGAHVGYHTLRLLRDCPFVSGAVAVEANPDTAELLNRNLAVNLPADLARKVTVLPIAAWDGEATVRLVQVESGNSGDFRVRVGGAEPAARDFTVQASRLDTIAAVREHRVGLVKVDLQGSDHHAVAGLAEIVHRDRPHIVCEFSPSYIESGYADDPVQVLRGYRELGYRPIPIEPDGTRGREHTDEQLVRLARTAESEFISLWLRPN